MLRHTEVQQREPAWGTFTKRNFETNALPLLSTDFTNNRVVPFDYQRMLSRPRGASVAQRRHLQAATNCSVAASRAVGVFLISKPASRSVLSQTKSQNGLDDLKARVRADVAWVQERVGAKMSRRTRIMCCKWASEKIAELAHRCLYLILSDMSCRFSILHWESR